MTSFSRLDISVIKDKSLTERDGVDIGSLFNASVQTHSDKVALFDKHQRLTYRELDLAANKVANTLLADKVNTPVVVYIQRSIEAVIAIVGIVKAGLTYVPVDKTYSTQQLAFICQDCGAKQVMSDEALAQDIHCYLVDNVLAYGRTTSIAENMISHAAYIMYTSGSTGAPKGVLIPHSGITRLVINNNFLTLSEGECVAHCSSIGFDASTLELWYPLLNGGSVYVIDKYDVLDFTCFEQQLKKVDTLWLTVALFNAIVTRHPQALSHIRKLLIGGDVLNIEIVRQFLNSEHCHLGVFLNGYGPTENTTFTTTYDIFKLAQQHTSVPIGKAISGTSLSIVDNDLNPVKEGEAGELIASGEGVALGYTCAEETKKKFYWVEGQRFYKTGDIVRQLSCGNLEFISRKDNEVKIRGFRVNLSQVEQIINTVPAVRICYVRPDTRYNHEALVAYIETSQDFLSTCEQTVRRHLQRKLPQYMIPNRFVVVDDVPMTRNGKADLKALELRIEQTAPSQRVVYGCAVSEAVARAFETTLVHANVHTDIHRGFFELGGNSLQIYALLGQIADKLGIQISISEFLLNDNIAALAKCITAKQAQHVAQPNEQISSESLSQLPISPAQKRLWYVEQISTKQHENLLTFGYRIHGPLNVGHLREACAALLAKHNVLQTSLKEDKGQLMQHVATSNVLDFEHLTGRRWKEIYQDEVQHTIELDGGSLIRFRLVEQQKHQFVLLVFSTHLVLDGWSVSLLIEQLGFNYQLLNSGQSLDYTPNFSYSKATYNMLNYRDSEQFVSDLAYWQTYLQDSPDPVIIPRTDVALNQTSRITTHKNQFSVTLGRQLTALISQRAKEHNISLFGYLVYYYGVALCRFSALDEVLLAVPSANRDDAADIMGMFVNTIPVRLNYKHQPTLKQVHQNICECLCHAKTYLDEIKQHCAAQRIYVNLNCLQVGIAMQNTGHDKALTLVGCESQFMQLPIEKARFDLFAHCRLIDEQLEVSFEFDSEHIYLAYVEVIADIFKQQIRNSVEWDDESQTSQKLNLIAQASRHVLKPTPLMNCLTLACQTAANEIAVVEQDNSYTFSQLASDVARMQQLLQQRNMPSGGRIGVQIEPSYAYIVSIMAILSAECSFVPLDANYPQQRLEFIAEDAELVATIVTKPAEQSIYVGQLELSITTNENLVTTDIHSNEACLLYTSGSTGIPKGVSICRDSILRLAQQPNFLKLNKNDRFLVASSPAFDASLLEVFVPLLNGISCSILTKQELLNYQTLEAQLISKKINTAWLTVSLFNDIYANYPQALAPLQNLLIGGDALQITTVRAFLSSSHCRLNQFVNGYGPTECTTFATWFNIFELQDKHTCVPIGKPINDTFVYILNTEKQSCRVGEVGEIAIGAPWLRPNYNKRAVLNDEKFIINPNYDLDDCYYLYLTGDLARYNPDLDIEYIGRLDKLVKIRGNRVELGGINKVLSAHEYVANSHVCVVDNNGKSIYAYVVKGKHDITDNDLYSDVLTYLRHKLEPFQIPSVIIVVDEIPLTINGKVDQSKLPSQVGSVGCDHIAATTDTQKQLFTCWQQLLNSNQFCITDSFFDIGGHSLLVPKVINFVQSTLSKRLSFVDFLQHSTIKGLAEHIDSLTSDDVPSCIMIPTEYPSYPMTSQQLNLYFSHELSCHQALYNIPVAKRFTQHFNESQLQMALQQLLLRHRVLGATFEYDDNDELVMMCKQHTTLALKVYPVANEAEAIAICKELAMKSFELDSDQLFECYYLPLADKVESLIFINIHHIIADEASIVSIYKALIALYNGDDLPASECDFMDFCWYQNSMIAQQNPQDKLLFWQKVFAGYNGLLKFTTQQRLQENNNEAFKTRFELSSAHTVKLAQLSQLTQASLFELSLAVYQLAVIQLTQKDDIVIGFPYSERAEHNLLDAVGYFVDIIPSRVQLVSPQHSVPELKEVIAQNRRFIQMRPTSQTIPFVPDVVRHEHYALLVQNAFSFHTGETTEMLGFDVELNNKYSRFDSVFNLTLNEQGGMAEVECVKDLYTQGTPSELFAAFTAVIEKINLDN
ncbi:AMP-binding protein [Xenorhabdus sp. SGI240]|uniref:AMP-binding protein n=1 Tax=Xenorhabdus sp. SGI240 TaxID=3158262 RepID=UPI0032B76A63